MRFWVGTTDTRWFEFLSARQLDEVNFWHPSVRPAFDGAPIGMPFLFKVKRPYNHIAGAGYFITRSVLPLTLAWEIFGEKNGAASLAELRDLIGPLVSRDTPLAEITCQVIANPVFFAQRDWLPDPPGWSSNIVRGKMYDTGENAGAQIWSHVLPLMARGLEAHRAPSVAELPIAQEPWSTVRRARPDAAPPWPGLIPRRGDRCLSTPLRDDW